MNLIPVVKEQEGYDEVRASLLEKFDAKYLYDIKKKSGDLFDYEVHHGYARNTYTGKLKEGIELTPLELAMILDSGHSWFGGSSDIDSDGNFKVTIFTD